MERESILYYVWNDPWIKDSPYFKPTTPIIDGLEELKVATLWSLDRRNDQ